MLRYKECLNCKYRDTECPPIWYGETYWGKGPIKDKVTKTACVQTYPNFLTPLGNNCLKDLFGENTC